MDRQTVLQQDIAHGHVVLWMNECEQILPEFLRLMSAPGNAFCISHRLHARVECRPPIYVVGERLSESQRAVQFVARCYAFRTKK